MTNANITTLVATTLNAAASYGKGIEGLRNAFKAELKGTMSPDTVRAALLVPVAVFYGVATLPKTRGEGYTLDKDAKGFEAAKKALQRLTADICGKTAKDKEELEVPADMLALAAKLVAMGTLYENSARLIAAAMAQARAK